MVKEYNTSGNTSQIQKVLKVLGEDFSLGHNPNQRKGGLIGLAAVAIALGKVKNAMLTAIRKRNCLTGFEQLCERVSEASAPEFL